MKIYDYSKFWARVAALVCALLALGLFPRIVLTESNTQALGYVLLVLTLTVTSYLLFTYRTKEH